MIKVWKLTWICYVVSLVIFFIPILSWIFFKVGILMDSFLSFFGGSTLALGVGLGLTLGKYVLNHNEILINQKVE